VTEAVRSGPVTLTPWRNEHDAIIELSTKKTTTTRYRMLSHVADDMSHRQLASAISEGFTEPVFRQRWVDWQQRATNLPGDPENIAEDVLQKAFTDRMRSILAEDSSGSTAFHQKYDRVFIPCAVPGEAGGGAAAVGAGSGADGGPGDPGGVAGVGE